MPGYGTIDTTEGDIELQQIGPLQGGRVVLRMPLEQPEFSIPVLIMMFFVTFAVIFWTIWFLASPPTRHHNGGAGSGGDSGWLQGGARSLLLLFMLFCGLPER